VSRPVVRGDQVDRGDRADRVGRGSGP
jgi:hypothetical protein